MTKTQKAKIAALYGAAAVSAIQYLRIRRTERAKRAEIDAKLAKDLAALNAAHAVMMERLENGAYDSKTSVADLIDDFEFFTIAAHIED